MTPEGMTSAKLRKIADWFDTYDKVYATAVQALGEKFEQLNTRMAVAGVRGTEIQDDLRKWADAMDQGVSL